VLLFGEVLADIFTDRTVLGGAPFNVARHLKDFRQAIVHRFSPIAEVSVLAGIVGFIWL